MNDLILEKSQDVSGLYNASMHEDGEYFVGCGATYEEAINRLLEKLVWYFHGEPKSEQLTDDDSDNREDNGNLPPGVSQFELDRF